MFPNLEHLSITFIDDAPGVCEIIWERCQKLKTLGIGIDMDSYWDLMEDPSESLDSILTGISPEECAELRELSGTEFQAAIQNTDLVTSPSIVNLQGEDHRHLF